MSMILDSEPWAIETYKRLTKEHKVEPQAAATLVAGMLINQTLLERFSAEAREDFAGLLRQ